MSKESTNGGLFRYGIEAPYVPAIFGVVGLAALVLGLVIASVAWIVVGVLFLVFAGLYLHSTLAGKLIVWRRELDTLYLRGDERNLDLGCGRGAVLIETALRLPRGRGEGIDLWRSKDQSGNDIGTAQANAGAAGVADRVELATGDMTALPYADNTFDLVTSALAVHNVPSEQGRRTAIQEAIRVLKPGGRLVLADFRHIKQYETYAGASAGDVGTHSLGWNYWYGGSWAATSMLTATKPGGPNGH